MSCQLDKLRSAPGSRHQFIQLVVLAICLLSNVGCQSFHPFAREAQQNLFSVRRSNSGGLDAFHKGRLEQAKGIFARAAVENPNDPSVRENLARTLYQSGDKPQAISQMEYAAELSNNDPRILVELGEMRLEMGQLWHAEQQVSLALGADNRYAPAWALSGKTKKANGELDQALANFQRALAIDPDLQGVQMQIVDTYQRMNKPRRALSAVDQVLIKHPPDELPEQAVLAKCVALMDLHHLRPAIDLLQTASNKQHASSEVFARLGQAQLDAGQISQARMTLQRGQQRFPNLVGFQKLIGDLDSEEQRVASISNVIAR